MSIPRTTAGVALTAWTMQPDPVGPIGLVVKAIVDVETEAAKLERERLRDAVGAAIERNHGQRGHPQPFIDCQREICKWGWDAPIDIFAEPAP